MAASSGARDWQALGLLLELRGRNDAPASVLDAAAEPLLRIEALLASGCLRGAGAVDALLRAYLAVDVADASRAVLVSSVLADFGAEYGAWLWRAWPALTVALCERDKRAELELREVLEQEGIRLARILAALPIWAAAGLAFPHPEARDTNAAAVAFWAAAQTRPVWDNLRATFERPAARFDPQKGKLLWFLRKIAKNLALGVLRRERRVVDLVVAENSPAPPRDSRNTVELVAALVLILTEVSEIGPDEPTYAPRAAAAVQRCLMLICECGLDLPVGPERAQEPRARLAGLVAAVAAARAGVASAAVLCAAVAATIALLRSDLPLWALLEEPAEDFPAGWWEASKERDRVVYALRRCYETGEIARILGVTGVSSTLTSMDRSLLAALLASLDGAPKSRRNRLASHATELPWVRRLLAREGVAEVRARAPREHLTDGEMGEIARCVSFAVWHSVVRAVEHFRAEPAAGAADRRGVAAGNLAEFEAIVNSVTGAVASAWLRHRRPGPAEGEGGLQ